MARTSVKVVTGAVLVAAVGAAGVGLASRRATDTGTPDVTSVATGTTAVKKVNIAERRQVSGTLGYAGTFTVIASGSGLLTQLPPLGTVVGRGQPAYETDGRPVILLYGGRPAWRPFQNGMTDGVDVEQLESNLKELGYGAGVTVDQHFNSATATAIRRFQQAKRLVVTGTVPLGQVVFLPGAVRVSAHDLRPGTQVEPGAVVEHGTGDQPAITAQVSPQQLPNVKVDTPVVVTLPDGSTRPGKVSALGTVAQQPGGGSGTTGNSGNSGGGSTGDATVLMTVQADGTITGFLDQATVRIAITVQQRNNVLAVPITALNAVPGGEYEVIVVDGTATHRVKVRTGLFDEFAGLAEVSGDGLAEGQNVQVPRDDA